MRWFRRLSGLVDGVASGLWRTNRTAAASRGATGHTASATAGDFDDHPELHVTVVGYVQIDSIGERHVSGNSS
jgi:hypothetical protein